MPAYCSSPGAHKGRPYGRRVCIVGVDGRGDPCGRPYVGQLDIWRPRRHVGPQADQHLPGVVEIHGAVDHLAKQAGSALRADRDEISPELRIVVTLQAKGAATMPCHAAGHAFLSSNSTCAEYSNWSIVLTLHPAEADMR